MASYGQESGRNRRYNNGSDSDRRFHTSASSSNPRKRTAGDDASEAWLADEDNFMLQQQKKKAEFRVNRGIAKPIDRLAIGLRFIDPTRKHAEDEVADTELDFVSPEEVFKDLQSSDLKELAEDIKLFLPYESNQTNKAFWETMSAACEDRRNPPAIVGRNFENVINSVHDVLRSKTLAKLIEMEQMITAKMESNAEIDVDYWISTQNALRSYKSRAMLQDISKKVVAARAERLESLGQGSSQDQATGGPDAKRHKSDAGFTTTSKTPEPPQNSASDAPLRQQSLQYDREVARGLGENEEIFANEVEVETVGLAKWQEKYRPRKPLYFNRVHMGFDWNKYNQSHYTTDNPPPKKPQGYRFVLFLPELVNPMKTPDYRIEREGGRKRGEIFAPAGEDEMCIIRFMCGAPYEDVAFRIVDRDWDYSAKQRGFKAEFRDGILEVSFFFKKVKPYER